MWRMMEGPNFLSYSAAKECMDRGVMESVAITSDLILVRTEDESCYRVICKGVDAGEIRNEEFLPIFNGTPAAKRAQIKLLKEGIPCI